MFNLINFQKVLIFLPCSLFLFSCGHQQVAESRSGEAQSNVQSRSARNVKPVGRPSSNSTSMSATNVTSGAPQVSSSNTASTAPAATAGSSASADNAPIVAQTETVSTTTTTSAAHTQPGPQQNFSFVNEDAEQKAEKAYSTERFPVNPKKIGVIIPVTGRNSNLTPSILEAIRVGLGIVEGQTENQKNAFSLAVFDSQGNAEVAASGVEKLLREENVVAILGGFVSSEAQAIAARAEFFKVPFMAFSQRSGLTDDNEFTFRNAITAEMQVNRLVDYAYTVLGARRFGLLYPNDAYGVEFANQYWDHVLARQGTIAAAQIYDPKETDLSEPVKKLVGTFHIAARKEEFDQRKKELADKDKKRKETQAERIRKSFRENETKENILPPIVNFDVLFIPDSSRALGQVLAFLKSSDVIETTVLGTNLWNSSELGRRVGLTQSKILFVDAHNDADRIAASEFHQKFLTEKQLAPTLLDAQSFEAASILRDVLSGSNVGREALADRLSSLGRRPGAYSELVMSPTRELQRELSILTLDQSVPAAPIKKID